MGFSLVTGACTRDKQHYISDIEAEKKNIILRILWVFFK